MNETDDLVDALEPVVKVFQDLGISHYVGGSVASSFHGAARSTMDVDLVCELGNDQVGSFIGSFGDDFYVSESAIRDAVKRKGCFYPIHLPTSFKIDVFISRNRPFDVGRCNEPRPKCLASIGLSKFPLPPLKIRLSASWNGIA